MVPSKLAPLLEKTANCAINLSLMRAPRSAGEVDFVKAVVVDGVRFIGPAWAGILRQAGYAVELTGVFCHQSPRVKFRAPASKPKCCELADLLVVVDDLDPNGEILKRMAVLVQAKMATHSIVTRLITSGDLKQLDLYSNWHPFDLPKYFSRQLGRNFATCRHPGTTADCGRYGLITKQPVRRWHQRPPAKTMPVGGDELGTFLARMAASQTGYGREATGCGDDWSRTVKDLLEVTANKHVGPKSSPRHWGPRGQSVVARFESGSFADHGLSFYVQHGPFPPGGESGPFDDDGPSDGISYLHVEISQGEGEGRDRSG